MDLTERAKLPPGGRRDHDGRQGRRGAGGGPETHPERADDAAHDGRQRPDPDQGDGPESDAGGRGRNGRRDGIPGPARLPLVDHVKGRNPRAPEPPNELPCDPGDGPVPPVLRDDDRVGDGDSALGGPPSPLHECTACLV